MDGLSTDILLLGLPGDVRCAYSRLGLHQASDVRANAEMCSSVTGFPAPPVATPAQGQGKRKNEEAFVSITIKCPFWFFSSSKSIWCLLHRNRNSTYSSSLLSYHHTRWPCGRLCSCLYMRFVEWYAWLCSSTHWGGFYKVPEFKISGCVNVLPGRLQPRIQLYLYTHVNVNSKGKIGMSV